MSHLLIESLELMRHAHISDYFYIYMYTYVHTCIFAGCVVLVIDIGTKHRLVAIKRPLIINIF